MTETTIVCSPHLVPLCAYRLNSKYVAISLGVTIALVYVLIGVTTWALY